MQLDSAGVFVVTCTGEASSTVAAGSGKCNPILAAAHPHPFSVILIPMLDIYGR